MWPLTMKTFSPVKNCFLTSTILSCFFLVLQAHCMEQGITQLQTINRNIALAFAFPDNKGLEQKALNNYNTLYQQKAEFTFATKINEIDKIFLAKVQGAKEDDFNKNLEREIAYCKKLYSCKYDHQHTAINVQRSNNNSSIVLFSTPQQQKKPS